MEVQKLCKQIILNTVLHQNQLIVAHVPYDQWLGSKSTKANKREEVECLSPANPANETDTLQFSILNVGG